MEGDRFISTTKNSMYQPRIKEDDDNFFMQTDGGLMHQAISQPEPLRHLNDYDSNILQEGAYRDVQDEIFKLEYKISRAEHELADIEKQIQTAGEINDYYLVETLKSRKTQIEEDLRILTNIYNEASLSAKISGGITSKIRDKFINAGKFAGKLGETLISKLPRRFASIIEIRNSLSKLENINQSVDELMNSRYPYGESGEKYDQLSRYIARANSIQSEIYKFMK